MYEHLLLKKKIPLIRMNKLEEYHIEQSREALWLPAASCRSYCGCTLLFSAFSKEDNERKYAETTEASADSLRTGGHDFKICPHCLAEFKQEWESGNTFSWSELQ